GAPRRASPWLEGLKCGHLSSLVCTFAGVTCPPPTSVEHADIRVKSYKLNSTERYTCNTGFKRKAGTSTLTECVLNKTTNTAHWTIPNLKCIRDPSLTHLKPSSTEMPAGVTPEPESTSLSGKEPAFTSKSDSTVATKAATEPGSRLIPSKPPAAGTTGVINNEPSRAPAQTTAKALEHTPSASQETPGYPGHSATLCLLFCATASLLCSLTSVLCLGSVSSAY
uniref:Interleukin-15 receptor subunit alpha n=1 Tax=Panthera tigris altaica TaxID=74533 RepID=A0A8C9M2U2_PANTA